MKFGFGFGTSIYDRISLYL